MVSSQISMPLRPHHPIISCAGVRHTCIIIPALWDLEQVTELLCALVSSPVNNSTASCGQVVKETMYETCQKQSLVCAAPVSPFLIYFSNSWMLTRLFFSDRYHTTHEHWMREFHRYEYGHLISPLAFNFLASFYFLFIHWVYIKISFLQKERLH